MGHGGRGAKAKKRRREGKCSRCGECAPCRGGSCCSRCRKNSRSWYAGRVRSGTCRCGKPATPGRRTCEPCIERRREQAKEIRRLRLEAGRCTKCGRKPQAGRRSCGRCSDQERRHKAKLKLECRCHCGNPLNRGTRLCDYHMDKCQERKRKLRLICIEAYGGACRCCGEKMIEFLQFDHVNDDGAEHRKKVKPGSICRWLIDNGFPDGIQLLCANCNYAKAQYGRCPHHPDKEVKDASRLRQNRVP